MEWFSTEIELFVLKKYNPFCQTSNNHYIYHQSHQTPFAEIVILSS